MEMVFLGTSSMVPTKDRNHTSIFLDIGKSAFLFDCGEGTQRQLTLANLKANKISHLFISHWHGDHVLGIPGLIQTLAARNYEGKLRIYGPKTTKQRFEYMFKTFIFDKKIDMEIIEIKDNSIIYEDDNLFVKSFLLNHTIETYGFVVQEKDKRKIIKEKINEFHLNGESVGMLQKGNKVITNNKTIYPDDVSYIEKGKKITLIFDTTLSKNLINMALDSDIVICEATYMDDLSDKASEYKHMTSLQAAQIASQANAKKLILTHFSARYSTLNDIVEEAKKVFSNTIAAYDLMRIKP